MTVQRAEMKVIEGRPFNTNNQKIEILLLFKLIGVQVDGSSASHAQFFHCIDGEFFIVAYRLRALLNMVIAATAYFKSHAHAGATRSTRTTAAASSFIA